MITNTELPPWLTPHAQSLKGMLHRGQLPQSLLIHGMAGTGRSRLARWLAAELLGVPAEQLAAGSGGAGADEAAPGGHPNFWLTALAPDKKSIGIDQVRELISFLQLKSYQGGARVALLLTADLMSPSAANALLKTLEEPPPDSTIILLAARLARLPATIISRCHRLRVGIPSQQVASDWLEPIRPGARWIDLLDCAGGAPLLAMSFERAGLPRLASGYDEDLRALQQGRASPVTVAQRWASDDLDLALHWLYWRAARAIRAAVVSSPALASATRSLQSGGKASNICALFAYLRDIERVRRQQGSGLNMHLQLGALLTWWCGAPFGRESET
jgi:DNA polymerase-3 subunit delta'